MGDTFQNSIECISCDSLSTETDQHIVLSERPGDCSRLVRPLAEGTERTEGTEGAEDEQTTTDNGRLTADNETTDGRRTNDGRRRQAHDM